MIEAQSFSFDLEFDGESRHCLVHIPVGLPPGRVPLVLMLHGRGVDGAAMARMSGMNDMADRAGFIAVYPDGRVDPGGGHYWLVDYSDQAAVSGSPELPFIDQLLEDLFARLPIDPRRVYACGFSNGAILALALARWRTERFAAVATIAGIADFGRFQLSAPISLIHFHGTKDRLIPFEGGKTARKAFPIHFPPVAEMLAPWLEAMGCVTLRHVRQMPDPDDSSLSVQIEEFGPSTTGSEAIVVTVHGGGHTWPGRAPLVSYLGKWTTAIQATEMIWEFFERHARDVTAHPLDA